MREVQINLGDLAQRLNDVITRVTRHGERIVLVSGGQAAAAVIGLEDLHQLQGTQASSETNRYASALAAADRVREKIQQWQTSHGIDFGNSVETLHILREEHDARYDDLR